MDDPDMALGIRGDAADLADDPVVRQRFWPGRVDRKGRNLAGARRLRDRAKTGYRAPYLADLSRRVLRGEVVPESWQRDPRATAELAKDLLELPGVGPYVAQNLLKFMGRPQGLGLDSWMRAKYGRLFHGGRRVSDRTIERRYRKLGVWAGPALWLELTRDWWGDGDEPSGGWDSLS